MSTHTNRQAPFVATQETPRMPRRFIRFVFLFVLALSLLVIPASASASAAQPWWQILDGSRPTNLWEPTEGSSGRLILTITNLGDGAAEGTKTPITITDELPEGVVALSVEGSAGYFDKYGPLDCTLKAPHLITCTFEGILPPYEALEVDIPATLTGSPPAAGAPGTVTVSGGNAPPESAPHEISVSPEEAPFGIERFSARPEEPGGDPATQAGAHPYQQTTTIQLNSRGYQAAATRRDSTVEEPWLPGTYRPALPRNLRFPLPAGFVGNTTHVSQCEISEFFEPIAAGNCRAQSAIGVAAVTVVDKLALGFARVPVPVFKLPPKYGEPARFGFSIEGTPVIIDTAVDPDDRYRIIASVSNTTQLVKLLSSTVVLWGDPSDPSHDATRGWACLGFPESPEPCERPPGLSETPFLRAPVSCDGPLDFGASIEPWNVPLGSLIDTATYAAEGLHGCNQVPFTPAVTSSPSTKLASNPSGLEYRLDMPNSGLTKGEAIAEGQPKRAEVILPEGMTINPSQAEGLATCSAAQYAAERSNSTPGAGCPDASKLGEVRISTPLLTEQAHGSVYIATPFENPFGTLAALYMVARIPERGILVKQAGRVDLDPQTGQITTTFDNLPQVPFSTFDFRFRPGARAPLATPPACGTHEIVSRFTPHSAKDPENPLPSEIVTKTTPFEIERGPDGGACPGGGLPPFGPALVAGTTNNAAGSFSPFNVKLTRSDREQEITNFSIKLPPGVAAKLAGLATCSDAAIAQAASRTGPHGGAEELASPSCPASSEVGRTLGGAGVGQVLAYAPGRLYLAGPYKGAPVSIVAITSGVVGPFDIGTIVVRLAIKVNPETGEVFLDATGSDPIPHIVKGVVLHLRDVRAYTDRSSFTFNPTSCEPTSTSATVLGSGLDFTSALDDNPFVSTSRFQAADCAALPFKPKLTLSLIGQKKRAGNPALKAHLEMGGMNATGAAESGLAYSRVALPKTLFLDNAHIGTVCTRVQFRSGTKEGENCPAASIIGSARAITPILDEPLAGPIYLRSNPERELPDIAASLQGQRISVVAVGHTDSAKGGGLRNTFEVIPDAPIDSVDINLFGGKRGLIESSRHLCSYKPRAKVEFKGHNGKQLNGKLKMKVPGCGKKAKGKKRRNR